MRELHPCSSYFLSQETVCCCTRYEGATQSLPAQHKLYTYFLCRLRPDNPYLLLDEFGENAGDSGGEITTELGVMSNEEEQEQQERPGKSSGAGFGRQGGEIDR